MSSLPGVASLTFGKQTVTVHGNAEEFDVSGAEEALKECGFPANNTESLTES